MKVKFSLPLLILTIIAAYSSAAFAEDIKQLDLQFKPSIPIPGLETIQICAGGLCNGIATYVAQVFRWGVGFAALLAVVMIIYGGFRWMFGKPDEAKKVINNSIVGLLLALGTYTIMYTINPETVALSPIRLGSLQKIELDIDLERIGGSIDRPPSSTGRPGALSQYDNAGSPSGQRLTSFDAYFTAYYKPAYGDARGYENFWCHIGMECSCPGGKNSRDMSITCAGNYRRTLHPCKPFPEGTPYCTTGASGKSPTAHHTIAADRSIPFGCKVMVDGRTLVVEDRGGAITGTHFDYFLGSNINDPYPSGVHTVTMDPATCFR